MQFHISSSGSLSLTDGPDGASLHDCKRWLQMLVCVEFPDIPSSPTASEIEWPCHHPITNLTPISTQAWGQEHRHVCTHRLSAHLVQPGTGAGLERQLRRSQPCWTGPSQIPPATVLCPPGPSLPETVQAAQTSQTLALEGQSWSGSFKLKSHSIQCSAQLSYAHVPSVVCRRCLTAVASDLTQPRLAHAAHLPEAGARQCRGCTAEAVKRCRSFGVALKADPTSAHAWNAEPSASGYGLAAARRRQGCPHFTSSISCACETCGRGLRSGTAHLACRLCLQRQGHQVVHALGQGVQQPCWVPQQL